MESIYLMEKYAIAENSLSNRQRVLWNVQFHNVLLDGIPKDKTEMRVAKEKWINSIEGWIKGKDLYPSPAYCSMASLNFGGIAFATYRVLLQKMDALEAYIKVLELIQSHKTYLQG
jgi:hypothetical protein